MIAQATATVSTAATRRRTTPELRHHFGSQA